MGATEARMDVTNQDWLLVKDIATELRFSENTIYGWLEDGLLVGHRISGSWRVKRHDLDAFIAAGRNVPEAALEVTP
jgi:excisionase family DNA binding protein